MHATDELIKLELELIQQHATTDVIIYASVMVLVIILSCIIGVAYAQRVNNLTGRISSFAAKVNLWFSP